MRRKTYFPVRRYRAVSIPRLLLGIFGIGIAALAAPAGNRMAEQVGVEEQGRTLLPTGQAIRPVGQTLTFAGRPVDMALAPNGQTLYVKDDRGVVVIDTARWKILQELKLEGGTSMHGIAVSRDGAHLYVTNAGSELAEADVASDGTLTWKRTIRLPGDGASYPCGLALSPEGDRAFVCLSRNNSLGVIDLKEGRLRAQIPVGVAPWGVRLSADGKTAFVSNWGGDRPGPEAKTALSSGTPTEVDARGIASSGSVSIVDSERGVEAARVKAGLHPCDLALTPDGKQLYVANANSDTLTVLSVAERRSIANLTVHSDAALPFGSAPNGLAFDADGKRLYVAEGGANTVAVLQTDGTSLDRPRIQGRIPTGWYPGSVLTDGSALYIASIKGVGSRGGRGGDKGRSVYEFSGLVQRLPLPTTAQLRAETAQATAVSRNRQILQAYLPASGTRAPVPVPGRPGAPSVFTHVVYILKENRTYDQVLGDLKQGNGDSRLCTFGREITPNHHALAEQYVLLDNFYSNGVNSADGHSWATEGNVTDHLEKSFGGFTRSYTFGDDPLTYSSSGFLWDNALAHGRTFRNFGEMDYAAPTPTATFPAVYHDYFDQTGKIRFTHNIGIENLRRYSSPTYPGWNLSIPDVVRADLFLKEFKAFEASGDLPNLTLIYLPSDHTGPNIAARSYLADNDLALGRVVEGISHSRFWPQTCIFVVEDDSQNGWDHVDGHRAPCLVISPYTRRGSVVHAFYNQTSVLHTMEQILGLPPMNQMDAAAPLMRACFTATPDLRPYTALANTFPILETQHSLNALRARSAVWARWSREVHFDRPDESDDATLDRLLWHAVKGVKTPYPLKALTP